ncbi:MAG: M48 family metalloprotease [Acidimicrobiales bacterium]
MPTVSHRALVAIPAAIAFVVVLLALIFVISPPIAALVALAVAVGIGWFLVVRAPGLALSALGARPLEEALHPRAESLVESICASFGISEPQLYTVDTDAIDAAVVGRADATRLVITRGALEKLDRLELEAVVGRELSLFGNGIHAATVMVSVSKAVGPLGSMIRGRLLDGRQLARADIDGVQLTRYPPALAKALEKARAGAAVDHDPMSCHLWMVGPARTGVQPLLVERIDTLREL